MRSATPHLVCKKAANAIKFYKRAFGAVELFKMPSSDGKKFLLAEIHVGDSIIMLNDEFPEWKTLEPTSLKESPITLMLYVKDVDAFVARAVKAGAKVTVPVPDMKS